MVLKTLRDFLTFHRHFKDVEITVSDDQWTMRQLERYKHKYGRIPYVRNNSVPIITKENGKRVNKVLFRNMLCVPDKNEGIILHVDVLLLLAMHVVLYTKKHANIGHPPFCIGPYSGVEFSGADAWKMNYPITVCAATSLYTEISGEEFERRINACSDVELVVDNTDPEVDYPFNDIKLRSVLEYRNNPSDATLPRFNHNKLKLMFPPSENMEIALYIPESSIVKHYDAIVDGLLHYIDDEVLDTKIISLRDVFDD